MAVTRSATRRCSRLGAHRGESRSRYAMTPPRSWPSPYWRMTSGREAGSERGGRRAPSGMSFGFGRLPRLHARPRHPIYDRSRRGPIVQTRSPRAFDPPVGSTGGRCRKDVQRSRSRRRCTEPTTSVPPSRREYPPAREGIVYLSDWVCRLLCDDVSNQPEPKLPRSIEQRTERRMAAYERELHYHGHIRPSFWR